MDHKYQRCAHLKEKLLKISITEEELHEMSGESSVLPLFEQQMSDLVFIKKHSLASNKLLRCRWQEYVTRQTDHTNQAQPTIILPNNKGHFRNYCVVYDSNFASSLKKRKHMKAGPGKDIYGDLPIPNDRHVRQSRPVSKPKNMK